MKKSVIITAGGTGKRIGAEIPKQFLEIGGKPVLIYSLERIYDAVPDAELILTLPAAEINRWNTALIKFSCRIPHVSVAGGESRAQSVSNGLAKATGELIAIHDGVRPFVKQDVVRNCFSVAEKYGSAVPVISVDQSLRRIIGDKSESRKRDDFRLVQTPQVFRSDILRRAYEGRIEQHFDDAGLVEAKGFDIHLVEGNPENIKITTPFDLIVAEALIKSQSK